MNSILLLLDLEETVIDNWHTARLLPENIETIKECFGDCPDTLHVGLMSWAVWDAKDLETFNTDIRPRLEEQLGMKFSDDWVFSMDDWAEFTFWATGKRISRDDFFDMFNKEHVLFALRNCERMPNITFLVDDTVTHMGQIVNTERVISTLNIFNMVAERKGK